MVAWRLVKKRYADTAFSGVGAGKFGGRWNPPGVLMVYTSSNVSLAVLETVVHATKEVMKLEHVLFRIEFPESLVGQANIPADKLTDETFTQTYGLSWATDGKHPILRVPSAVIPHEDNFLLNPMHADFGKIKIGEPQAFVFDHRIKA